MKKHIIYLFLALFFVSCAKDNPDPEKEESGDNVNLQFNVELPQQDDVSTATRAINGSDVKDFELLIFDQNKRFLNRINVPESQITVNQNTRSFSIDLEYSNAARTIHLIANSDNVVIPAISVGALEQNVMQTLKTKTLAAATAGANITPLVMWGVITLPRITTGTSMGNINLLRAAASIQVKKSDDFNIGSNTFTINAATLHSAANTGLVTQFNYRVGASNSGSKNPLTTAANIDYSTTSYSGNGQSGNGWNVGLSPYLFTYERPINNSSNYLEVIVNATYNGESGYYKIAIVNSATILEITRNHRYVISITNVNQVGLSYSAAIAGQPSNALKWDMTDENEDMLFIEADGQYRLGISNNEFKLHGATSGSSASDVILATVHTNRVNPIFTISKGANASWLTNLRAVSIGDEKYHIKGSFVFPAGDVSSNIIVASENLRHEVEVNCYLNKVFTKDANSYIVGPLLGSNFANWEIEVLGDTPWMWLHPSKSTLMGSDVWTNNTEEANGLKKELSSRVFESTTSYVHIESGNSSYPSSKTTVYFLLRSWAGLSIESQRVAIITE